MGKGRLNHRYKTYYCAGCGNRFNVVHYKKVDECPNCGGKNIHVAV